MSDFADNWRELSGDKLWTGLLDPLSSDLRRYIIHYGERAGAIDDGFVDDKLMAAKKPEFVGRPRYRKAKLFEEVGLVKGNPYSYDVTNYVYGTPKLPHEGLPCTSNLMAYIAVSSDAGSIALGRRDILIAWRGTKLKSEGDVDRVTKLRSAPEIFGNENAGAMVHSGWYDYYTHVDAMAPKNETTSCRDQILEAVRTLVNEYSEIEESDLSITITGRGTGAAFAILSGMDIVCNSYNLTGNPDKACLVSAIVFGAPPVGNEAFATLVSIQKMFQILRVTNELDAMPKPLARNYYKEIGEEVRINTINSPFLKNPNDHAHELEVYLHGIAAQQGINDAFTLTGVRDILMVNKTLDGLKNEHKVVPAVWLFNKFMVQDNDGKWALKDDPVDED